ncbi:preprotein translocase subunit SecA [Rhodococcus sp. ABRD24]|nr:preprotein translocase subunit SecA [Rhodococcus sp. ABRD24]
MVGSLAAMQRLIVEFAAAEDPSAAIDAAFNEAVAEFVEGLRRFDAIRLIEVARLAFLPMAPEGETPVTAEASAALVELLALIALAAQQETSGPGPGADLIQDQEMSGFVSNAKDELEALLHLAQIRTFIAADPQDKFTMVSLRIRASEVLMRNPSYPAMAEETNLALLDGEPTVHAALKDELGFDASEAHAVLNACDHLQQTSMNDRIDAMRSTTLNAMCATRAGEAGKDLVQLARSAFFSMFEPDARAATVAIEDIVTHTGVAEDVVTTIVERFRVDLRTLSITEVVDAFTTGRNPMRTRPLIASDTGRVMLPHPALNTVAIRESLEEHLKKSPAWSKYAKHRGDLLESRTRSALGRLLPGAHFRDGFEYYVPASDAERVTNDPARYTKRVEGDHLVIIDDVAIVVEDKAVALSALARGGKTARIRTDLTGIITKAADQASRIRDGIERDRGLRIESEGWVDLSHIREIHTIAVSLDDISAVLSATAELVRADLLALDNIPWTVSLHDFELISELVDHPAEFLLYLRRRRHPDVTVMFSAPDELDLFLHFFEEGLWVEPDPAQVRVAFPFMHAPTTAELRRFRAQQPALLTSRTDQLDSWYYARNRTGDDSGSVPKPTMVASPIRPLLDELQSQKITGWLSITATLLSASTQTQRQFARYPSDLLDNPSPNGLGRSLTVPITASVDPAEGWILVWATSPPGADSVSTEKGLRDYLRAKKYQLGIPRGVVFLYDEATRDLIDAYYDGHIGPLDTALTASLSTLRPPSDLKKRLHPNAFRQPKWMNGNLRRSGKRNAKR